MEIVPICSKLLLMSISLSFTLRISLDLLVRVPIVECEIKLLLCFSKFPGAARHALLLQIVLEQADELVDGVAMDHDGVNQNFVFEKFETGVALLRDKDGRLDKLSGFTVEEVTDLSQHKDKRGKINWKNCKSSFASGRFLQAVDKIS